MSEDKPPAFAEDKLHRDIARGNRARAIIDDELLVEAFARLDADYVAAWRATAARDTYARERLWQATQIVGKVRGHLTAVLSNGKLAQRQLDELAARTQRTVD
jgi:hypothetical protein